MPDNVPAAESDDKNHYQLATSRAHPLVRKLIDRAALELEQDRTQFLFDAAIVRAFAVLGEDEARRVLDAA